MLKQMDKLEALKERANQKDPSALMELGVHYAAQMVCTQDYLALSMLRDAAEHDLKDAQFWLGFMLSNGRGTHDNISDAKKWYGQAASKGHADAKAALLFRQKGINRETLKTVFSNPELRLLDLANMSLRDAGLALLCDYLADSSVEELHLKNNGLTSSALMRLAEVLPYTKIRVLDLWQNEIDCAGIIDLSKTVHDTKLEILDLANNKIGDKGVIALCNRVPRSLHTLHLGDNKITLESAHDLSTLFMNAEHLRIVDLGRNRLGAEGALRLSEGLAKSHLEVLDVAENEIGNHGFAAIMKAAHGCRLSSLDIKQNGITDRGLLAVKELFALTALKAINFRNNGITHYGAVVFQELPKTLELLNVRSNPIGNAGLVSIAAGLASSSMETLNLANNKIDHEGLKILMACTAISRLKTLNLSGNQLKAIDHPYLSLCRHSPMEDLDLSGSAFDENSIEALIEGMSSLSLKKLNLQNTLPATVDKAHITDITSNRPYTVMLWHEQNETRKKKANPNLTHQRDFSVAVLKEHDINAIQDKIRGLLGERYRVVQSISLVSSTDFEQTLEVVRERLGLTPEQKNLVFRIKFVSDGEALSKQDIQALCDAIYEEIHENKQGYFSKVKKK